MEESYLKKVDDSVKKYAEVISAILDMDVDIADDKLIRIAGTGKFLEHVNKNIINEGNAFKNVLKTKRPLVINNPGSNEVCMDCPNKNKCTEKYEISWPIILDNSVIGVIALALFDENKVKYVSDNLTKFMNFLENIADLIAAKVSEYKSSQEREFSLQLLKKLIDFINEGVIVFDDNNSILFMNKKAENLLGHTLNQLNYLRKIKKFSIRKKAINKSVANVEYNINVKDKKYRLLGNIYPIKVGNREMSNVFIFQDIISLHQKLFQPNQEDYNFNLIIGKDENFLQVKEEAKEFAYSDMNLLIRGESGTGKEVFARAIHNESRRRDKPFVSVVCSGTVDSILEKEIFGFLSDIPDNKGISKFELANGGGTLFIDEIGDLSLRLQGRLLEIMQRKKYDVRFIVTTAKNLETMVKDGEFRKDLYYTIEPFSILIPPVRSRKGDIRLLVDFFLDKYNNLEGKDITLEEEVYDVFMRYSWPGNVREIEYIISLLINIYNKERPISINDLPRTIKNKMFSNTEGIYNLERIEKETIIKALNSFGNTAKSKELIAKELGISKATFYRKLQKYSIIEEIKYKQNVSN